MMRAWVDGPESDAVTDNAPAKVWRATPKVPANWQQYAMTQSGTLPKILPGYERNDATYKGVEGMEQPQRDQLPRCPLLATLTRTAHRPPEP